jgi:hypothetical protein
MPVQASPHPDALEVPAHPKPVETAARPSAEQARKRIGVRHASDAVQRTVWSAFFIVLGISLGFGLFLALR